MKAFGPDAQSARFVARALEPEGTPVGGMADDDPDCAKLVKATTE